MSDAFWMSLAGIIGSITALIIAIKGNKTANTALAESEQAKDVAAQAKYLAIRDRS